MVTKTDLITAAEAFREALFNIASVPTFSHAERDGFTRLLQFYQDRLEVFKDAPRYGDSSDYYDNPTSWAKRGTAGIGTCLPGQPDTQQPTYDAANSGVDALDGVTAAATANVIRGSLLVSNAAAMPTALIATADVMARTVMTPAPFGRMLSFGAPPVAPPVAGAGAAPPPSGPVPPPKTAVSDPPWFAKLMTMFPAEAVTAYLTGAQYFDGGRIWLVLVTLVAVVVVRWIAMTSPDGKPNVLAVAVAAVSFLLWVGATTDVSLATQVHGLTGFAADAEGFRTGLQKSAGFAILIWTWVVPALVKLNPDASAK